MSSNDARRWRVRRAVSGTTFKAPQQYLSNVLMMNIGFLLPKKPTNGIKLKFLTKTLVYPLEIAPR
ncbi:hypothetical protein, partial [Acidovorax sp.]|uniref:hypothetical protein n=1 Tax=Acidovorax sp. TaxID=1872122 RepID=UPI00391F2E06